MPWAGVVRVGSAVGVACRGLVEVVVPSRDRRVVKSLLRWPMPELEKFAVTMATCIRLFRDLLIMALKTTPVLGLMVPVIMLVVLSTLRTFRLPELVTESSMCAVLLTESLSSGSETVRRVVLMVWALLEEALTFTTVALVRPTTAPILVKLRPTTLGMATRLATFRAFRERMLLVTVKVLSTAAPPLVTLSSPLPGTMTTALM